MSMPVDLDFVSLVSTIFDDLFVDEMEQLLHTVWRDVTTGVTNAESSSTKFHGSQVNLFDILRF